MSGPPKSHSKPRSESALQWVIAYKLIKAVLEVALGVLLLTAPSGLIGEARVLAEALRDHATGAWSVALAEALVHAATGHNLAVAALAALADGAFSFFEGWTLHRRYWWSRWLVVIATSSLLPFEIVALVRRLSAGRIALFVVNLLIVVVMLWQKRKSE